MKVFVERNEIAPIGISLKSFRSAENSTSLVVITQENPRQPLRDLTGDFPKRQHLTRTDRTFDFEVFAEVMMKLLERFDHQIVQRKPDRTTPIRVTTKQSRARLGRLVSHPVLGAIHLQHIRMVFVKTRNRTNAIRRKKFVFIEHEAKYAAQLILAHD